MIIKSPTIRFSILIAIFILFFITGCSRGNSVLPDEGTDQNLPAISDAGTTSTGSERSLLGVWEATFDVESMTAKVEPIRSADFHLNVLPYIERPSIFVRSWNPDTETVDVDVSIYNSSVYHGFDVRLIIFNDTIGHKLLNPDNYTHLWDIPGGTWSNGFKAYLKQNPQRCFHSLESASENLRIKCPDGNFNVKFAIDACHPFNCPEPYLITNLHQGTLQAHIGAFTAVTVDVFDWQYNANAVRIQCPAITGETDTYMTKMDLETWGVSLTNNTGAPAGEYFALIAAGSEGTIEQLIDYETIIVTPENETGWARSWGGEGEDQGWSCVVDKSGNVYVVGSWYGTVDFDPDPVDEDIRTTPWIYCLNAFVSKFDNQGDYQWVWTMGGSSGDNYPFAINCDSSGYVYIGGRAGSVFDGAFFVKISPNGETVWEKGWGTSQWDVLLRDIEIDSFDNIYVSGTFDSDIDFNPDPILEDVHQNNGRSDGYICKYSTDGTYVWGRTWGGEAEDYPWRITSDSSGNIYCAGHFFGLTDFDPGPLQNIKMSNGECDCFLTAFSSKGEYMWTNTWGGNDREYARGLGSDENDNLYFAGEFQQTVDFDPDPLESEIFTVPHSSGFVSKFKSDADFLWVYVLEHTRHDDIYCDKNGSFYISGYCYAPVDFDPGPSVTYGDYNYLVKYDTELGFQWVSQWNQLQYGQITSDLYSNIYLAGWFSYFNDFDPGPGEYYLSPVDYQDVFLVKVLPNGLWEY